MSQWILKTVFCFAIVGLSPSPALAEEVRVIEVSAIAEKAVEPDQMSLNVEIWSKAATASRAQMLAAEKTKEVQTVLDQYKIRKEDIQTQNFSFGPEYTWDPKTNQNRLVGFRSTQVLQVTLRKIADGGRFVDALTQSAKGGGNPRAESGANVNAIQWDSSKKEDVANESLGDAVRAARRKADELAKAAGVKIRGVHRITHVTDADHVRPDVLRGKSRGMMMAAEAAGPDTAMAEGQIKVRVTVVVEYDIGT